MKNQLIIMALAAMTFGFVGCGSKTEQKTKETTTNQIVDAGQVTVYYFHSKQRCKTCLAIQDVAEATVKENFSGNEKVVFVEIDYSESVNEKLADKYEISMSSLIIAKAENHENLTDAAFANALRNPEVLKTTIKETINKYLNN